MEILIRNAQTTTVNLSRLKSVGRKLLQAEGCTDSAEVSVLLVDDATITEFNKEYRGKNKPTDVLSFYQNEDGAPEAAGTEAETLLGDVVISVETAKRQAEERNKNLDDEMALLLAHGILHLLGFTDYTEVDAQRMQERAAEIIGREAAR